MGNLKNKKKYAPRPLMNPEDTPKHDEENLEIVAYKERKQEYSHAWQQASTN
jgi:hypothetical protein